MRKQPVTQVPPIDETSPVPALPAAERVRPDDDDTRIVFGSWDEPLVPR